MWPKIHLQTKLVFKFYYWSKAKQGQTVHKLQIATFWEIYIHIYPVKRERERDIIKFCVFELLKFGVYKLPAAARSLKVYYSNVGQTDLQTYRVVLSAAFCC